MVGRQPIPADVVRGSQSEEYTKKTTHNYGETGKPKTQKH